MHCTLLLDYILPEEPLSTPLGNTLRIKFTLGDPNWTGGDLETDLASSCSNGEGRGALGGNFTVCRAAEMKSCEVANLNLGWQRRWTPSCNAD